MRDDLLIVIPAPLHKEGFPRIVLRPLHKKPLLARMIDIAGQAVDGLDQVWVLTDGEEVALLANRKGCRAIIAPEVAQPPGSGLSRRLHQVVQQAEFERGASFEAVMVLRPFSPLIKPGDIEEAVARLLERGYDTVLSACPDVRHTWKGAGGICDPDFGRVPQGGPGAEPPCRETGAFLVTRRAMVTETGLAGHKVGLSPLPPERAIDIHSRLEWWICERLLRRWSVVFAVVGHTAVGLGHVSRVEMLAHELIDHDVAFVCTRESALAAQQLGTQPFPVHMQGDEDLADTVLAFEPDLVVNDILNTEREYVMRLKESGARVVNFEDLGPGADVADFVINAIYDEGKTGPNRLNGPDYFCLRDEFLHVPPRLFRDRVEEVLITFGGTDPQNSTNRVARLVLPIALERGIHVSIVTGAGYLHAQSLEQFLRGAPAERVELANGTRRISDYMARADLAFSSAGRTVFELAAMRVPGIIIASNPREEVHTFAREKNGMRFLGRSDTVSDAMIIDTFKWLLDSKEDRRALRNRTEQWDFRNGQQRILRAINTLLEQEHD